MKLSERVRRLGPGYQGMDDQANIARSVEILESELAKYKQMYPIVHDKMRVCAEKFKEQQSELSRYRDALKEISEKRGMCIYGSSSTPDNPDDAFRYGSALANNECADIANRILGEKK